MNKIVRYLALCVVILLVTLGSSTSSNHTAARVPAQDEACQQACEDQLLECFFSVQTRSDGNKCIAA
jgi:hypothetical protein